MIVFHSIELTGTKGKEFGQEFDLFEILGNQGSMLQHRFRFEPNRKMSTDENFRLIHCEGCKGTKIL